MKELEEIKYYRLISYDGLKSEVMELPGNVKTIKTIIGRTYEINGCEELNGKRVLLYYEVPDQKKSDPSASQVLDEREDALLEVSKQLDGIMMWEDMSGLEDGLRAQEALSNLWLKGFQFGRKTALEEVRNR